VAFSPDGKTIVSGSDDKTLKVWDAGASASIALNLSPQLTAPLPAAASLELKAEKQSAHSGQSSAEVHVAFSPDGMTIVSSSDDSTIKVWDAGAWALPPSNPHYPNLTAPVPAAASLELKAEKQRTHVTSVAFSPDGTTIVSGSSDKTIKALAVPAVRPLTAR